ncbi:MAG: hypothetical protein JSS12_00485 [Verrucomicrobia bacterium]|nr:hypothetical protein [Verrucomicrobiota bacterium]
MTQADFMLPNGLHSFAQAVYDGKWVIFSGRVNGLHGFSADDNNFPPDEQNRAIYVIDHHNKSVLYRDMQGSLAQEVIDTLSVSNPQFYQKGDTLYMTGGYGIDTATGKFSTKDVLSAINIPGLIDWVEYKTNKPLSSFIRQVKDEAFRVTGGEMSSLCDDLSLLVFGQNFDGIYYDGTNGDYTRQVRRFTIHDDGKTLRADIKDPIPAVPYPSFRRRDLNVVPIMEYRQGKDRPALMAYSGVFTETIGIWTVPVIIMPDGSCLMDNPEDPNTLKQAMNNYVSPTLGLYSKKSREMYTMLFGGLSYGYFDEGGFETDPEVPFVNHITTIKRDAFKKQTQHLMKGEFPVILSQQSNPGNPLLFGTGAGFFAKTNAEFYSNGVVKFDKLPKGKTHIGYIVGGIMSTLPNTSENSDSAASPYIFKVYITKK